MTTHRVKRHIQRKEERLGAREERLYDLESSPSHLPQSAQKKPDIAIPISISPLLPLTSIYLCQTSSSGILMLGQK